MGDFSSGLLTDLLRQVSRSFYLTLRVLPAAIRPQIGLAYLLARTSDTIADTPIVAPDGRLQALQSLRDRILGDSTEPLDFGELARQQDSPAEWSLLQRIEESLALLERFATEDRLRIREALAIIISGQQLDLKRFAEASRERIVCFLEQRRRTGRLHVSGGRLRRRFLDENVPRAFVSRCAAG